MNRWCSNSTTNRQIRKREENQTEGILRTTSNSFNDLGNLADLETIDMLINIGLSKNLARKNILFEKPFFVETDNF